MATGAILMKEGDKTLFDSVASRLARAEHFAGFSCISTPLLFPSGGTVSIRVSRSFDGFLVTDFGFGAEEADLIGGKHYYSRIAQRVAEAANVGFDQHSFFVLQVSEAQLPGAVSVVANCVHEAVTKTFYKVEERRVRDDGDRVYDRLSNIFNPRFIARNVSIIGSSNHEWQFDTGVTLSDGSLVLFESVSKHHSAIFPAVAKFHDVARSEHAPRRTAVIGKRETYGDYVSLLSQAASVVELTAPDDVYRKIAA